jgi:RNA polymerase sigma-70 factor (ECF subfamily)
MPSIKDIAVLPNRRRLPYVTLLTAANGGGKKSRFKARAHSADGILSGNGSNPVAQVSPGLSDASRLVEQSRRGDRRAFQEIVAATARLVYSKIALDVPDRHRAEDLTQEVYLLAWRSIANLEEPAALRAWLLAIAASVVANDARRVGRKKRSATFAPGLDAAPDPGGDPLHQAQEKEERSRAVAALRSLPEEYQRPLALRYLTGAGYEEIGRQLALTNGALRGLMRRGLQLLRKRLTE